MTRARLAWTIAGLDLLLFLITSLNPSDGGVAALILYLVGLASFTVVGAVLITRVPENPIGILLLGAGTVLVIAIVIGTYANVGATQVPPWPLSDGARIVGDILFVYPFVIAFIGVPLLFPDGRLPSPRFRWVVRISIAGMVAWTVSGLLFDASGQPRNAVGDVLAPATPVLQARSSPPGVVLRLGPRGVRWRGDRRVAAVSPWRPRPAPAGQVAGRRRRARGDPAAPALLLTDVNPELASTLSGLAIIAMFALPVVIGIAILRYRLYEIDRIISRTLGWAIVTALLAGVLVGGIVVLQAVLAPFTNENTIAVAASTLVAFALFQPLRRRVQRAVDHRFDRARYDGQRTADAFAEHVRSDVDLGHAAFARSRRRPTVPSGQPVPPSGSVLDGRDDPPGVRPLRRWSGWATADLVTIAGRSGPRMWGWSRSRNAPKGQRRSPPRADAWRRASCGS